MSVTQGVSLAREQSRAEVYLICGGAKLWIPSPAEFDAAGLDWAKIQVVPDGALGALPAKPFGAPPSVKASDVFFDCQPPDTQDAFGNWTKTGCHPSAFIVRKNVLLAGWIVDDPGHPGGPFANSNTAGVEDVHYELLLDPDFIAGMYGPGGLSAALNTAVLPGNPVRSVPAPFQDIALGGSPRGVTLNSFYLPGGGEPLHNELNCWHVNTTSVPLSFNWFGRGPAPAGWTQVPFDGHSDSWWPYHPLNPDGSGNLRSGDYVLMKGTLWIDGPHMPPNTLDAWDHEPTSGLAAWMEIHPPDWIVRLPAGPPPSQRKTYRYFSLITEFGAPANTPNAGAIDIFPGFPPSSPTKRLVVGNVQELVDQRFTDISTVDHHTVTLAGDHATVDAAVVSGTGKQGRFKAVYLVSWQEQDLPALRVTVTPYPVPISAAGQTVTVTVHAEDAHSGVPVAGTVRINAQTVGTTNTPFTYTFRSRRVRNPDGTFEVIRPTGTVSAPGYPDADIDFGFAI
ncbi:MAG: hypothetical protein ACJ8CR_20355 [Roseiflexaceae bacterium]